ncbi:MAG: hypothetical protein P8076_09550 [Gammaproteobacteria bacterium]
MYPRYAPHKDRSAAGHRATMRDRRVKCKLPPKLPAAAVMWLALAAAVPAAEIRGTVAVGTAAQDHSGAAEAGISVAALPLDGQALPAVAAADHRVIIRHNRFQPVYLAVRRGDRLTFVNQDPVYHRIFSPHGSKGFDVRLAKPGTVGATRTVTLDQAGSWQIFGRIFPRLYGRIDVVDTPYIRNLSAPGRFGFSDLALGRWQLRAAAIGTAVVRVETEAFTAPPPVRLVLPLRGGPHAGDRRAGGGETGRPGAGVGALFPVSPMAAP